MCGIFAILLKRPLTDDDIALGRYGTNLLTHRGPDYGGEWVDRHSGVFFGHRRLTIIDPSQASRQPMVRDGRTLCYNGEIYNYRSLRARLKAAGMKFSTNGDVEVLLNAWIHFGPETVFEQLDGMFAFVMWDGREAQIAVDPFGEKPLYVAETQDGLYLSSELPPLVELLELAPLLQPRHIFEQLALGYIRGPGTVYPGVTRMMPGHSAVIRDGKLGQARAYWRPTIGEVGTNPALPLTETQIDRLHTAIVDSTKLRLESDMPACMFLSSGVDSALVAAILARDFDRKLECIHGRFTTGPNDESEATKMIAEFLGLPLNIVPCHVDLEYLTPETIVRRPAQPNSSVASGNMQDMLGVAKKLGYRVALMGMGGDEISFGYQKHVFAAEKRWLYDLPEFVRLFLSNVTRPLHGTVGAARQFSARMGIPDPHLYLALKNDTIMPALRRLDGFDEWVEETYSDDRPLDLRAISIDVTDTLPNTQLINADIVCMSQSIEIRTPFLNRNIWDLVAEFDPRAFTQFGQKSVLRRIADRYYEAGMIEKRKIGFRFPLEAFIKRYGSAVPQVSGIPDDWIDAVWVKSTEPGWCELAARLLLLSEFEKNFAFQVDGAPCGGSLNPTFAGSIDRPIPQEDILCS